MEPPGNLDSRGNPYRAQSFTYNEPTRRRSGSQSAFQGTTIDPYSVPASFQGNLTKMVWEASTQQVKQAVTVYTNIDIFRPYFDVEPREVRNRLIQSLLPRKPSTMKLPTDLYGPTMLIFTMVALLLYAMKSSEFTVKDGTLIGTAFVTCFGYWLLVSLTVYAMGYVFSADISFLQVLSILGYALFGHCIVLALSTFFHPVHDHLFFYGLLFVFSGMSAARMALYFAYKCREKAHKLILPCVVCMLHIGFILYLHFGYHRIVEEIGEMLGESSIEMHQKITTVKM